MHSKRRPSDLQAVRATEAHLPALVAIYNHYIETSAATFDTEPQSIEDRQTWLAQYLLGPTQSNGEGRRHQLFIAMDTATGVLGYASSSAFRHKKAFETSVEVSIYCAPGQEGRGVASFLYEHLFKEIKKTDVHRAYAIITVPNEASIALHKKFGFYDLAVFSEVGRKFGRYWDVLWMEKTF
jgi:phosphinothricin acetyltransferase